MLGQTELITIIDESVLRREIGDPEVMYGQLRHLTTVAAVVQILPAGAATYRQYEGQFLLATLDGTEVCYIESSPVALSCTIRRYYRLCGGACVEVASLPDRVLVRDSEDSTGPALAVTPTQWRIFLTVLPR